MSIPDPYRISALLTRDTANPKTAKSARRYARYRTRILHLAPHRLSGRNVCPWAHGCKDVCLGPHAGRGRLDKTQRARLAKTVAFFRCRDVFLEMLGQELDTFTRACQADGKTPCVRLNGTSDIRWYRVSRVIQDNPQIRFYDYTKDPHRLSHVRALGLSYHITFSRDETNEHLARDIVRNGGNSAVVFRTAEQLAEACERGYRGLPVINADEHDLRFLDRPGAWSGLYAKGDAVRDRSGFVVDYRRACR